MKTTMIALTLILLATSFISKNPVKMSVSLVILSGLIFLSMFLSSGDSWFPLIFFLLFMGGVLIMFMILSSLLPNEPKTGSMKWKLFHLFLMLMTWKLMSMEDFSEKINLTKMMELKMLIMNSLTFYLMATMTLMYFFFFSVIILTMNSPLRSNMC